MFPSCLQRYILHQIAISHRQFKKKGFLKSTILRNQQCFQTKSPKGCSSSPLILVLLKSSFLISSGDFFFFFLTQCSFMNSALTKTWSCQSAFHESP